MAVTLQDIARFTNTSRSTVSRYLNGGSVSLQKSKQIAKAILEMNYQPNINARRLALNKSGAVAVIFDDISDYIYCDLIAGIEQTMAENDYNCLFFSRAQGKEEEDFLHLIPAGLADGLIFVTFRRRVKQTVQMLKESRQPMVIVGDTGGDETVSSVDVDNRAGTCMEILHLIDKGHRKIAYLKGPEHMPASQDRFLGYLDALNERGIVIDQFLVKAAPWNAKEAYNVTASLLSSQSFTALAASNSYSGYGALMAVLDQGYRVPEDISLVAFDEAPICELARPAITTARQPIREVGVQSAKQLIRLINKPDSSVQSVKIVPEMIYRVSSGM